MGTRVIVGGLLAAVLAVSSSIDQKLTRDRPQMFYVPPASVLKVFPGSLRFVFADLYYILGIMAIAEEEPDVLVYVHKNFRAALELDPGLTSAYVLGGVVAPRGTAEIPQGILFLKDYAARSPQDWRIPFWIGLNYLQLGDSLKAAEYYQRASALPGAPGHLRSLAAWAYYEADEPELALAYLKGIAETVQDSGLRASLDRKLAWLTNLVLLEHNVREFHEQSGTWPGNLQELVDAGLLDQIPEDPWGGGYVLDEEWYKSPGRVRSRRAAPGR